MSHDDLDLDTPIPYTLTALGASVSLAPPAFELDCEDCGRRFETEAGSGGVDVICPDCAAELARTARACGAGR